MPSVKKLKEGMEDNGCGAEGLLWAGDRRPRTLPFSKNLCSPSLLTP